MHEWMLYKRNIGNVFIIEVVDQSCDFYELYSFAVYSSN
jgi:hypothetical protein